MCPVLNVCPINQFRLQGGHQDPPRCCHDAAWLAPTYLAQAIGDDKAATALLVWSQTSHFCFSPAPYLLAALIINLGKQSNPAKKNLYNVPGI
eukprot:78833-Pelagomonas_calceolata.AAC.8